MSLSSSPQSQDPHATRGAFCTAPKYLRIIMGSTCGTLSLTPLTVTHLLTFFALIWLSRENDQWKFNSFNLDEIKWRRRPSTLWVKKGRKARLGIERPCPVYLCVVFICAKHLPNLTFVVVYMYIICRSFFLLPCWN